MRPTALALALALLACGNCGILTAQEDTPAPSKDAPPGFVEAHLQQARRIGEAPQADGSDRALEAFKAQVDAKVKQWTARLETESASGDLLKGLANETLQAAQLQGASAAQAAAWLGEGVSLQKLLALAFVRYPDAQTARTHLRAVLNRFAQAAYLEDLVSQYRAFTRELETKVGPQSHKEMPGKTFPFPATLALKGELVDLEAEVARLQWLKSLRMALNETARGFFDVQYTDQAVAIVRENRNLFAQMESIAREQLKVGRVSQADSLKAQAMLAILDNQLVTLEKRRTNAVAKVNALLDLEPETNWGEVTEADLQDPQAALDAVLEAAAAREQDWAVARRRVELMDTMVRLAETMIYPRASAGMSQLAPSVAAEAGPTRKPAGAFPQRPMVNERQAGFGSNAAYIDELRVRATQVRENLKAIKARATFRVKDSHFKTDAARRDRKTYAELVEPKAKQAFDTTKERYNTAQVPFIEYLDAGRGYLDASLKREQARRDHNQSLTDLQDAMGESAAALLDKP